MQVIMNSRLAGQGHSWLPQNDTSQNPHAVIHCKLESKSNTLASASLSAIYHVLALCVHTKAKDLHFMLQKLEHASRSLVNSAAGVIANTESRLKPLSRSQPEVQWGDSQGDEQPGKRQRVASEADEEEVDKSVITAA